MGEVLVLVDGDERDGTVHRSAGVLLTIARRLGEPVAVLCGLRPDEEMIRTLARYGATRICVAAATPTVPEMRGEPPGPLAGSAGRDAPDSVAAPAVSAPAAAPLSADVLATLAGRLRPTAILIPAGYRGQETAGRLAVRLDSGVITDAIDVRPGPDGPVAVQSCLAHSYLVESSVRRGVPVITVRSDAAAPVPAEQPGVPGIESVSVSASSAARTPRVLTAARTPHDRTPPLDTADVVVAGGRGVGSAESFRLLADLAAALGGAVGGSHTATELGWCPRDRRIGLTGKTVHPRLYLASGISGSVRHRAGMQGAKTVVAIGDDPAAPIFRIADLGVVGDLHDVLPALLAEINRRKARRSLSPLSERDLTEA